MSMKRFSIGSKLKSTSCANICIMDFLFSQKECEKLQARIEALKADSSALCKELESLSEECGRIDDENKLIKVHHFTI